jgi:hypothetical protein
MDLLEPLEAEIIALATSQKVPNADASDSTRDHQLNYWQ